MPLIVFLLKSGIGTKRLIDLMVGYFPMAILPILSYVLLYYS